MRVPVEWLKEYVNFKESPERLAEKLLMIGVEAIPLKSLPCNYKGVVVGEIKGIKKHPNADKLQIAIVNISKDTLQIVCGAPNIEINQKVPVALVGAEFGEFIVKETEIRGVKSQGMICSEAELGISDDHTGIMVLDPESKVGANLSNELGKEAVLECEITPNRGDLLSIIGIAREISVIEKSAVRSPKSEAKEIPEKTEDYIEVEVKDPGLCPRYIARVIKGVKISPSPKWMQDRLSACGIRPINNVVDITNYVMLEWGQPLHAFDFDKLTENRKQKAEIIVRKARTGEEIETLDGTKRKLDPNMLAITSPSGPIAIAGVMGGANSEVSEETKTIILESATFNPTSVRKTAKKLGLRSESSNRFEKGIPMPLNEIAIDRAAELIQEICGGKVLLGRVDVLSKWIWIRHIGLKISKVRKILGLDISEKEIVSILRSLGFEAEKFDIAKEAKKHLGKPYKYGANFKEDGISAFDCSYLTDYLYSLIGIDIGHTAIDQYDKGIKIKDSDFRPGDLLFYIGHSPRRTKKYPKGVGHVGVYIGNGKVIDSVKFEYNSKSKRYLEKGHKAVHQQSVAVFIKAPDYLGARRYVEDLGDYIAVTVPWWRLDVCIEEDLIEEIARIYGYDKFPSTLPGGKLPEFKENLENVWSEKVRDIFCGTGLTEVYSYSFISKELLEKIGFDSKKALKISNPLSSEQEYMRTSLVPSLLEIVAENDRDFEEIKIFEIAKIYSRSKAILPDEKIRLTGAILGGETKGIKYTEGKEFYQAKGVAELLVKELGIGNVSCQASDARLQYLHPGRVVEIKIGSQNFGVVGEIHPDVLSKFGIKSRVAVFDLDFNKIISLTTEIREFKSLPKFPAVIYDLAFVLDKKVKVSDIIKEIKKTNTLIKSVELFDVYTGGKIGKAKKSLAVRVTYQSDKKTLIEEEVLKIQTKIISNLEKKYKAKMRR